jgi:1-acyl-sn-glycerol-3-phosphate acyltransferase
VIQKFFHIAIIRPLVFVFIGLIVRGRRKLPARGPALVVSNHNSHLDTAVIVSLFPLSLIPRVRPAAAADYWLRSPLMSAFARRVMGIIPLDRHARERGEDPFEGVSAALRHGDIVLLYPEGTRGEPERMAEPRKGISYLIERHPDVPVFPVFLRGLGKALPRGSWLPVPFFCNVYVGNPIRWGGDREAFMAALRDEMGRLADMGHVSEWD